MGLKVPASWRTSLAGITSALAAIVVVLSSLLGQPVVLQDNQVTVAPVEQSPTKGEVDVKGMATGLGILGVAGGLLFARDNKVSDEKAEAPKA